jgi:hypothetical protein
MGISVLTLASKQFTLRRLSRASPDEFLVPRAAIAFRRPRHSEEGKDWHVFTAFLLELLTH